MLVKNGSRLSLSITVAAAALLCGASFAEAQERRVNLPLGESAPAAPAPTTLEKYVKTKWPLGRGSRGAAVKEMQKRLKALGYNVGADGVYGGKTSRALRKFQREAGLEDDGFFGKGTMKALLRAEIKKAELDIAAAEPEAERPTVRPRPRPTGNSTVGMTGALSGNDTVPENTNLVDQINDGRILRPGSKGSLVKDLQKRLSDAGFPVPKTGNFGPLTKRALQKFQRSKGLTADGVLGPQTANALVPGAAGSNNAPSTSNWMQIARSQLGVKEYSGSSNNPKIVEYHKTTIGRANDSVAWCSSFVNWVMKKAGHSGTNAANARSWLNWGRRLSKPVPGCVVVFWRSSPRSWKGHVGFYVGTAGSSVKVLGGNQGNAVTISNYPKSRVLGYRWPSNVPLP